MRSIYFLWLFSRTITVLDVSRCTSPLWIYWLILMTSVGNISNIVSFFIVCFFVLRSFPGNNTILYLYYFGFWPGTLDFFQLAAGVNFYPMNFVWLVRCNIICGCFKVARFCVWSNVWLIVSDCLPFRISKYRFRKDVYPKHNMTFSVLLVFSLPVRVQNRNLHYIQCLFLYDLKCVWRNVRTWIVYCCKGVHTGAWPWIFLSKYTI